MQQTRSVKVDEKIARKFFERSGYVEVDDSNQYVRWKFEGGGHFATMYTSGKLVVQGKGDIDHVMHKLVGDNDKKITFRSHIGSDEVGKGDYFGPLVVCAFYLDQKVEKELLNLGVADSKTISDKKIVEIYQKMYKYEYFSCIDIDPMKYNDMYSEYGNISVMLSHLHIDNIRVLVKRLQNKGISCNEVVIDQFSADKNRLSSLSEGLKLKQFHKGERDLAVAAASVFARAVFLKKMEEMRSRYGFNFPLGASNVIDLAREFVSEHGSDKLREVAKISFKTTQKVLFNLV